MKRRDFLTRTTAGLALYPALALAAEDNEGGPLAPGRAHFKPKAEQLVVIFLTGGFSHVDTFDEKPKLRADHGKTVPSVDLRGGGQNPLLGSPFAFKPCGRSGLKISELFPNLGEVADDLCVIRTLNTDIVEHFQAVLAMHTGSATVPMPSLGAWISDGLGTLNPNLPASVVLAEHLTYAGSQVWDCGFCCRSTKASASSPAEPIPGLRSPARSATLQDLERIMLRDVNDRHARERSRDANLRACASSFDVARGLMRERPRSLTSRVSRTTLSRFTASPAATTGPSPINA